MSIKGIWGLTKGEKSCILVTNDDRESHVTPNCAHRKEQFDFTADKIARLALRFALALLLPVLFVVFRQAIAGGLKLAGF